MNPKGEEQTELVLIFLLFFNRWRRETE